MSHRATLAWRFTGAALFLGAAAIVSSQSSTPRPAFTCPANLEVTETPAVQAPWTAEAAKAGHKFLRPSIYNGNPGGQEYELAPDDTQTQGKEVHQSWQLSGYRDLNLFVRCRYAGTAATVVARLAAPLKVCTFSFRDAVGSQPITAPSFECH